VHVRQVDDTHGFGGREQAGSGLRFLARILRVNENKLMTRYS
jgi:hypothetical protein